MLSTYRDVINDSSYAGDHQIQVIHEAGAAFQLGTERLTTTSVQFNRTDAPGLWCKIWECYMHACVFDVVEPPVRLHGVLCYSSIQVDWNYLHGTCVGQASNPGPWSLQVSNVVSASKHIENFENNSDCYVWSETNATAAAQSKILKASKKFKGSVVFSAPAAARRQNGTTAVGRQNSTGTLVMSSTRSSPLSGQWDSPTFSSGRISDSLLQVGPVQVRVIAVYGFHSGLTDAAPKNDILLGKAFRQADSFAIPTIIAGDFNCALSDLLSWQAAVARGFVDVAQRVASLHDQDPEPTYKGISRLDYVICNPLAATAFKDIQVDPNGYTDHAILTATFDWSCCPCKIPTWTFPRDLKNEKDTLAQVRATDVDATLQQLFLQAIEQDDVDQAFALFCQSFEDKVVRAHLQVCSRPLSGAYLGRGCAKLTLQSQRHVAVCHDSATGVDGKQLLQRCKLVQWLLELQSLQHRGLNEAKQVQLWQKIFRAPGFAPDFPTWLLQNDVVDEVPFTTPSQLWIDKVSSVLSYEKQLWQQAHQKIKRDNLSRCMQQDWSKGGRLHASAVKPTPLGTLDSLVKEKPRSFKLLRCKKGGPVQLQMLDDEPTPPGAAFVFSNQDQVIRSKVSRVKGCHVELDIPATAGIAGAKLVQETWTTDTTFIAEQVQTFWKKFWQTSKQPNMSDVHRMVQQLPEIPQFDPTVSAAEIRDTIHRLALGKARGMDGFSMAELKAMGEQEHEMLAALFNCVLRTGRWPQGLTRSFVSLLAKVQQPRTPKDARPITVLPTLYRLWGKVISQKIFQAILPSLSSDLYGSVPGKSAIDAAWELQGLLEEALDQDQERVGVSLDLSKAYNTIPRQVVAALAARCGWAPELTRTYLGFLDNLERYFKIHDGLHAPTGSSTGVPEGCPIAVPVMILITWMVTLEVTSGEPCKRLISYVDNWTMTAASVPQLCPMLDKMLQATDALALILNPEKTRAFATTPVARAQLAATQFGQHKLSVVHTHDDLGVVFSSTHKKSSCSVYQRLENNQAKLSKLRVLPWSAGRKAQVLTRVVAPAILYGVSLASTSPSCLATLRGKFSAAIWGLHHHRDHFLGLIFGQAKSFEPFVLIFQIRLRDLRRAAHRDSATTNVRWNAARISRKSGGMLHYMMDMIDYLGWQVLDDCSVVTLSDQHIYLCHHDKEWILQWVNEAWFRVAASKVVTKDGLGDIESIDLTFSQTLRKQIKIPQHITAAFTTNAAVHSRQKRKFLDDQQALCKLCGQEDTQRHRLLHCPGLAQARQDVPLQEISEYPQLLLERGLCKKPQAFVAWELSLLDTPLPKCQEIFDEHVHLFTDGSTDGVLTVPCSSWAVVLQEPLCFNRAVVASGLVPGRQSNYRAELYATIVAVQSAATATVYIDNQAVCDGCNVLKTRGWVDAVWDKKAEFLLWKQLASLLHGRGQQFSFIHVRSHRDVNKQS